VDEYSEISAWERRAFGVFFLGFPLEHLTKILVTGWTDPKIVIVGCIALVECIRVGGEFLPAKFAMLMIPFRLGGFPGSVIEGHALEVILLAS
jgi:hypothetical protein